MRGLSLSPVVPPGLSACKCGTARSASHHPICSSSYCLALSPLCPGCPSPSLLPVWMSVSSFNSSGVGLPCSSISWQFWLFFVFKFVFVLLLVVQGDTCVYLCLRLDRKSLLCILTSFQFPHSYARTKHTVLYVDLCIFVGNIWKRMKFPTLF